MPLNLRVSDGADFTPFLAYNAKAGRWYARNEGEDQKIQIISPRLLFDMQHIKTGWIAYGEGVAPEKVWDPSPTVEAPRPTSGKNWKRGFEVLVYGNDPLPGLVEGKLGLREFNHNAGVVINAVLTMHATYEAGAAANPGKVPYYQFVDAIPIESKNGTNYEPKFELIGWVDRARCPALNDAVAHSPPPSFVQPARGVAVPPGPVQGGVGYATATPVYSPARDPRDDFPGGPAPQPTRAPTRLPPQPIDLDSDIPF